MATKNTLDDLVKMLTAQLASGRNVMASFRGNKQEVEAVQRAVITTIQLREELQREGTTVKAIMEKLVLKRAAGQEFERALGFPFPL